MSLLSAIGALIALQRWSSNRFWFLCEFWEHVSSKFINFIIGYRDIGTKYAKTNIGIQFLIAEKPSLDRRMLGTSACAQDFSVS